MWHTHTHFQVTVVCWHTFYCHYTLCVCVCVVEFYLVANFKIYCPNWIEAKNHNAFTLLFLLILVYLFVCLSSRPGYKSHPLSVSSIYCILCAKVTLKSNEIHFVVCCWVSYMLIVCVCVFLILFLFFITLTINANKNCGKQFSMEQHTLTHI